MSDKETCTYKNDSPNKKSGSTISSSLRKSRITIDDVAREAGVSITTVSRVLNGASSRIGKATKCKVEEVAKRLHYTPNRLIRSLQEGKSNTVAYASFFPGLYNHDEVQQQTLIEIYCAAHQAGYDVLLPTRLFDEKGIPDVDCLLDGRCDGVFLEAPRNAAVLDILAERRFPTVVTGYRNVPENIISLPTDDAGGTKKGIAHLISLGHKRIAHLAGPVQLWDVAMSRLEAYMETMKEAGLPCDKSLMLPNGGTATWAVDEGEVETVLTSWLKLPAPPTAVFCASDRLAISLMEAIVRRGLRVPEDISVVGFDDMPSAQHCHPPLTTVRISTKDLVSKGMEMLNTLIMKSRKAVKGNTSDSKRSRQKKMVPAELVIRKSTAPLS